MPTEFKKDTIPKPVGLGCGLYDVKSLSSYYQVLIKCLSGLRMGLRDEA
jgi:hypothetical protein